PHEVTANAPLDDAEGVRGLLDEALRFDVELDFDHGPIRPERAEPDLAVVPGTFGAPPGDDLIGALLGDLGPPVLHDTGDRGRPFERLVVNLDHTFDSIHELGERFELRPLVVGDADGHG